LIMLCYQYYNTDCEKKYTIIVSVVEFSRKTNLCTRVSSTVKYV
jgi:hypothetical protein